MKLDVDKILSTAEGIYHQIISAPHLTDEIRIILGIPTVANMPEAEVEPETSTQENGENAEKTSWGPDMEEVMYQKGLDLNFWGTLFIM